MNRKDSKQMKKRAQSTVEYMVLIGVIVAALVAMEVYFKRGMQARIRGYAEQLNQGAAYAPGATTSLGTITRNEEDRSNSYSQNIGNSTDKMSISESSVKIEQVTNRLETTLPFAD